MRTAIPIVDLSLRSSSLVSRPSTLLRTVSLSNGEAYLANKDETYFLSVPRFTLHEIRFTQSECQVISGRPVMKDVG